MPETFLKRAARKIDSFRSPWPEAVTQSDHRKVLRTPAFQAGECNVFGQRVAFSDAAGFIHSVREIFADEVYKFSSETRSPHIVDAGANIGLSIIYFKKLYPHCSIVAFEPDPDIFQLLKQNVGHYDGVDLNQAAAWIEEAELTFYSEGSLAGSSEVDFINKGSKKIVKGVRLKDELKRPIDLLKIDIEGAENSVLFDIEAELANVRLMFFEYHSIPGKPQRLGDLLALVTRAGFRFAINSPHGPPLPFVDTISSGFDLQCNVFCFRPA